MRILSTILLVFISLNSFAGVPTHNGELHYSQVIEFVDSEVGVSNTCLDEYLKRDQDLRKFLIWAPPIAVAGTPIGFLVGAQGVGLVANLLGFGGWGVLGAMIMGGVAVGGGVAGTFIVLETARGIEFAGNRKMMKLITAARENKLEDKQVQKFLRKYRKKYPEDDHLNNNQLIGYILEFDESGKLCNGQVSGKTKKPRHLLAKRRHLIKYIHNNN